MPASCPRCEHPAHGLDECRACVGFDAPCECDDPHPQDSLPDRDDMDGTEHCLHDDGTDLVCCWCALVFVDEHRERARVLKHGPYAADEIARLRRKLRALGVAYYQRREEHEGDLRWGQRMKDRLDKARILLRQACALLDGPPECDCLDDEHECDGHGEWVDAAQALRLDIDAALAGVPGAAK